MKWSSLLARAPLPMLALAASYGVFKYAELYVPGPVAFVQAAAFELVYIGLAVVSDFDTQQRARARWISAGAVVASIIYNTLAALFHRIPLESFALPVYGELAFAALHGAPLAWVAYLVADLLLHMRAQPHPAVRRAHQLRALVRRLIRIIRTHPAQPTLLPAHVCRKCGASVESQQQAAASARWGCAQCKVEVAA